MAVLKIADIRLAGACSCVPSQVVDNVEALRSLYGDKAEGTVKATGILKRRVVGEGVTCLDLCHSAAKRLMERLKCQPEDFGAVLCVSFTQHNRMPCNAIQAQAQLGLPKDVIAFDIMLACSGWGYGLYVAGLLANQTQKRVLLLDGDVQTAFMSKSDAATLPVMADAGTATVVEPCVGAAPWFFSFLADGEKGSGLTLPTGGMIKMDGFAIFKFVAMDVSRFIREFMVDVNLAPVAVDAFVPHQANVFMIRQLAKLLKIAPEKLWVSGDVLGNSSSASVPTTLAYVGQREARNRKILFSGFGGGLSASVGLIDIDEDCQLECFDYGNH